MQEVFMVLDPLVARVVQRIARVVRPTRIILFGSRAKGKARANSDLDLLVVYDGPLSKRALKLRIHDLFLEREFSMDLFVLTSEEFERQKKVVSTVGRVADREGVVCYG